MRRINSKAVWVTLLGVAAACPGFGLERISLRNGFSVDCERREVVGEKVRLYLPGGAGGGETDRAAADGNYVEVSVEAIVSVEVMPDLPRAVVAPVTVSGARGGASAVGAPTAGEMREMLARAGGKHHVDADLLASVVRAESGGQVRGVSRTGARGLMQLMPGTAREMGVGDAFAPEENIEGGTAYLDWLLVRYHDDLVKAVAAYNAGPGAVDRYHGVPPYRETRAYVARVVREFNRRKMLAMAAVVAPGTR